MSGGGSTVRVLGILQARSSSTRLPGKVLKPLLGMPMLARQIERVRRARLIDSLVIATSDDASDDGIAALGAGLGVDVHRGSLNDVLDRFRTASEPYRSEWIVRLTGDCPVADPAVIDDAIMMVQSGNYDYVSNALEPTYPDGLDVEVVRSSVLETAWREAALGSEREHVTPFVHKRPSRFRLGQLKYSPNLSHLRWTVDEPRDFELITLFYEKLYPSSPAFSMHDILALIAREPGLADYNTGAIRNEGYLKSLAEDST